MNCWSKMNGIHIIPEEKVFSSSQLLPLPHFQLYSFDRICVFIRSFIRMKQITCFGGYMHASQESKKTRKQKARKRKTKKMTWPVKAGQNTAGIPVTSQKECTEDPSMLCQDFATALKCGSLERCYELLQVNNPKSLRCSLCKVLVAMMAKIVQDNSTDERLAKFFERGCQFLPFQDWSTKCKKMVDTGIIIVIELGKQVQ
ncbi:Proactivator polypeptide, partial [Ophiophagus hannah]